MAAQNTQKTVNYSFCHFLMPSNTTLLILWDHREDLEFQKMAEKREFMVFRALSLFEVQR